MGSIFGRNLSRGLSFVMVLSILWLGVFSMMSMDHGGGMGTRCPFNLINLQDTSQAMDSNVCANAYAGIVQNMGHVIPGKIDFGFGVASIIVLTFLLFARVPDSGSCIHSLRRVRYRDRFDKDKNSFFSQIKKWIALREERDPSYRLA